MYKLTHLLFAKGRLPRAYLDLSAERLARLSLYNAQQLLTQADRKREIIQSQSFSFLFFPFAKLRPEDEKIKLKLIDQFILSQNYDEAVCISIILMCVTPSGLV